MFAVYTDGIEAIMGKIAGTSVWIWALVPNYTHS